jgi:hypothetical protein
MDFLDRESDLSLTSSVVKLTPSAMSPYKARAAETLAL